MEKNEKDHSGTRLTEDVSAGSSAPDAATARHTPAPWRVETDIRSRLAIDILAGADDEFNFVANIDCREEPSDVDDPPREEAIANAHLIAAAPEMKEALEGMAPLCNAINALIAHDDDLRARLMAQLIAHGFRDDAAYLVGLALAKAKGR